MTYCSLHEAFGEDFEIQNVKPNRFETKMNPSRNNYANSRTYNVKDIQSFAHQLKNQDYESHRKTFHSTSLFGEKSEGRRFEAEPPILKHSKQIKAWGEVSEDSPYKDVSVSEENPRDMLKKSLMRERPSYDLSTSSNEPSGYDSDGTYKLVRKNRKCRDYFYHLDTCKKCQHKLKKRVVNYMKYLQRNKNRQVLPGSSGMNTNLIMDRELFNDNDHDDSDTQIEVSKKTRKTNTYEGFSNYKKDDKTKNLLMLMIFGLITIYVMDTLKK